MVAHYVQVLTEELADDNLGLEFHFGGSWRRGADVIGDLDILVITEAGTLAADLLDDGVVLPSCVTWQRCGPRIANGDLMLPESSGWPGSLHVDVWSAKPASRGAMLAFFTGPMELNLVQRQRAKAMGLAFSQNGLTDRATGQPLPGTDTEEGCYRALRMPYLTPEERQAWAQKR